ncbi:conserved hypothetical protein [uncultured Desulfobacterium sp.]|uniref:Uncharacterized protein n=1 Tax=uncultured Desulfobacterium sp. TaxID=201089 RepID=A0A445MSM4_9BACT|nr:conserved hypothetical protein [uncultured Desulfobacterium sp.]
MSRKNIHPYLSDTLMRRFKKYCTTTGATESSVVEEALQRFFNDQYDTELVLRRLNRFGRSIDRVSRDLDFLGEAFSVFVRLWFAHTPKVPDEAKAAANQSAKSRYQDFVEYVVRSAGSGKLFFDLLPREEISDDAELQKAVTQHTGPNHE